MTSHVRCCAPDTPLTDVARIMAETNCGAVPVCAGKGVTGMITDRDIVLRAVTRAADMREMTAQRCMTQPVITASPEMDVHEASALMGSKQIRRLPVVENGELVGIVALGDLATVRIHVDEAGQALSRISKPSHPGAH
jgi:CBS domain-containing protein